MSDELDFTTRRVSWAKIKKKKHAFGQTELHEEGQEAEEEDAGMS